ncbi:hypothetical protein PCE1_003784 [Barthelona sp. PCE]
MHTFFLIEVGIALLYVLTIYGYYVNFHFGKFWFFFTNQTLIASLLCSVVGAIISKRLNSETAKVDNLDKDEATKNSRFTLELFHSLLLQYMVPASALVTIVYWTLIFPSFSYREYQIVFHTFYDVVAHLFVFIYSMIQLNHYSTKHISIDRRALWLVIPAIFIFFTGSYFFYQLYDSFVYPFLDWDKYSFAWIFYVALPIVPLPFYLLNHIIIKRSKSRLTTQEVENVVELEVITASEA